MESKPVCMPKFEGKLKGGFKVDVCQSFGESFRVGSKVAVLKCQVSILQMRLGTTVGWFQC